MSDGTSPSVLTREQFDKAARLYVELGFARERAALTLARTGYPREWIREHFPEVSERAFPPEKSSSEQRTDRLIHGVRPGSIDRAPLPPRADATRALARLATEPAPIPERSSAPLDRLPALGAGEEATEGGISFQYVPLIQCSFPHADPGAQRSFTRRNGWLELTLTAAHPDRGLPYGVPARLLTIYCASEAIRTRSPEIFLGDSVNEFLRRLDVPVTRGERGSQRVYSNQLLRLIHCALSIDENIRDANGRAGLHIRQALFAEEAQLWWDGDGAGKGSSLVLSSALFDSILERSAPLSTQAIRVLRKSPMDLDVYAWLVHRLFHLGKPSTVTWEQLSGQFGHGYSEPRKFRHYFLESLRRVQGVYPEARLKVADVGLLLLPSRPHVARPAVGSRV